MTRKILSLALLLALLGGCGSPESSLKKARDLAAKGRHGEAIEIFKKVLAKPKGQPWLSSAWLDLAVSQKALAKPTDARSSATQALNLAVSDPDRIAATLFLAELMAANKEFDAAETLLGTLGNKADKDPRRLAVLTLVAQSRGAAPLAVASEFLNLDATRMDIGKVERATALDPSLFPYVQRYVEKGKDTKIKSPDGKKLLWRGLSKDGYCLYVSDSDGKNPLKLKDCKNAFQPAWAPDSKRVLYTAINWKNKKRSIFTYDLESKKVKKGFQSPRGVGAMAAFSTDGSKIAFIYSHELWMMNASGIGLTNVSLKKHLSDLGKLKKVSEASLLAWNRDGSQLAYQPMGFKDIFIITFVRRAS